MLSYALISEPGDRSVNEDAVGIFTHGANTCFVVCDGLGGHGKGEVASGLVRDVFADQFSKTEEAVNFLGQTFQAAQCILMDEQRVQNARHKMKTTAVALVTDATHAYIGHVGDSRLYTFAHNKVKWRTQDHSVPQMLALAGDIKDSEIRRHPDRNLLLHVMGIEWEEPPYELKEPIPLKKCQAFLLCSDGFWDWIDEKTMGALLKKARSAEEWLSAMVEVVRTNGKGNDMDNVSAIAVWNS